MPQESLTLMQRARSLWRDAGSPPGQLDDYVERARELIAQETNADTARAPVRRTVADPTLRPYGEPVEPLETVRNQGVFPELADQEDAPLFPEREAEGTGVGGGRNRKATKGDQR